MNADRLLSAILATATGLDFFSDPKLPSESPAAEGLGMTVHARGALLGGGLVPRGSRGVGVASLGLPAAVSSKASGDTLPARWDAIPSVAMSSAHLVGVTTAAGFAAVALAAWVCESEAGSATTPARAAVAREAALATTGGMMFSAAVAVLVLAVAAGLSVPSAAVSLSAVPIATPDCAGAVAASRLSAVAPVATVLAALPHGRSPEAAAAAAWLGLRTEGLGLSDMQTALSSGAAIPVQKGASFLAVSLLRLDLLTGGLALRLLLLGLSAACMLLLAPEDVRGAANVPACHNVHGTCPCKHSRHAESRHTPAALFCLYAF